MNISRIYPLISCVDCSSLCVSSSLNGSSLLLTNSIERNGVALRYMIGSRWNMRFQQVSIHVFKSQYLILQMRYWVKRRYNQFNRFHNFFLFFTITTNDYTPLCGCRQRDSHPIVSNGYPIAVIPALNPLSAVTITIDSPSHHVRRWWKQGSYDGWNQEGPAGSKSGYSPVHFALAKLWQRDHSIHGFKIIY